MISLKNRSLLQALVIVSQPTDDKQVCVIHYAIQSTAQFWTTV